jgi:hypothetical protein
MKLVGRFCLVCGLLLVITHRLPAPIFEESPTPSPLPKPEPSSRLTTPPKPKPVTESTVEATPAATQPISRKSRHLEKAHNSAQAAKLSAVQPPKAQASSSQNAFDGTWKGSINLIPARNWHGTGRLIGTFNIELIVTGDGTSIRERCRNASVSERTERDGKAIRWQSEVFKDLSCSLTPNPDGKTALVMFRNDFYGEPTATFERTSSER